MRLLVSLWSLTHSVTIPTLWRVYTRNLVICREQFAYFSLLVSFYKFLQDVSRKIIFQFVNSNENNLIYLFVTSGRKNKWILIVIVYLGMVQPAQLVCTPHSRRYKIEEKLLMAFTSFIGLCRISTLSYMEILIKKLAGPGPGAEISVHPSLTLSFFLSLLLLLLLFVLFCFWRGMFYKKPLHINKQIFPHHLINNIICKYSLLHLYHIGLVL